MEYTVEAFSWGRALIDPVVRRIDTPNLERAKELMNEAFEDLSCFHVRVLSGERLVLRRKFTLHGMRSRPNLERSYRHFMQKVDIPVQLANSDLYQTFANSKEKNVGMKVNVLRIRDFQSEISVAQMKLAAKEFFFKDGPTQPEKIDEKGIFSLTSAVDLTDLTTCLAAAAAFPHAIDKLFGVKDDTWEFFSRVDVDDDTATLHFNTIRSGRDFRP